MSLYGPPPNVPVGEALYLIFTHYGGPAKNHEGFDTANPDLHTMDCPSFVRMCKESPELLEYIGRSDIDVIFNKTKPHGLRVLLFSNFLDALLELALRIFPDDDPSITLSNFLAKFIFALFDQNPNGNDETVIETILKELSVTPKAVNTAQ